MRKLFAAAVAALALTPLAALAAGGHDAVGCSGCHSLHASKGEIIFAVAPNKTYLNPKTKQPYGGTTGLCLACHQDTDKGGQGFAPVSQHMSHPFGIATVNPKVAKVPPELLRDGRFECISCHDPHPSNPFYKYLRVDTQNGKNVDKFCAACHAMKADQALAEKASFFSSMDETGSRVVAPAAPAAAPAKPAAKPSGKK
ncbi:MAG: cytochrome C [Deltaproteobacteria bacterium]|nr:cytochrome C [Deltaproteobacteria bacterium]